MNFKRLLIAVLALSMAAGLYQYFRPAADRSEAASTDIVDAETLFRVFSTADERPASDFLDQVITVTGTVGSMDGNTLILEPGVACRMEVQPAAPPAPGATVAVKGRVIGYDDMFSEVQVDFAVLVD